MNTIDKTQLVNAKSFALNIFMFWGLQACYLSGVRKLLPAAGEVNDLFRLVSDMGVAIVDLEKTAHTRTIYVCEM